MKRVGIQTPHYAPNYGAQLQAFALGAAVRQLGYSIEYINRRPDTYNRTNNIIKNCLKNLEHKTRLKGFDEFEHIFLQPQSLVLTSNDDFCKLDTTIYHAIIVGSDQIWRDDYFEDSFEYSPYLFYIDGRKVKKISYAASFGKDTCNHPEERRKHISKLLNDFSAISVREASGVNILKNVFDVDGVWVADPTLLHDGQFYHKTMNLSTTENHHLATYILGYPPEKQIKVRDLALKLDLKVYDIYKPTGTSAISKRIAMYQIVPSVIDWLNCICNSKYVITDSYHGMIFCILFKKQFVVMNHQLGGSERFYSLLGKLGLQKRLMSWSDNSQEIMDTLIDPIDYSKPYLELQRFRKDSIDYLRSALL